MTKNEIEKEFLRIKEELAMLQQPDDLMTAKELGPKMKKSASYVYKLVHLAKDLEKKGKNGGIPYSETSPGTILFSWRSVNKWLHDLETKKAYWNFEDS